MTGPSEKLQPAYIPHHDAWKLYCDAWHECFPTSQLQPTLSVAALAVFADKLQSASDQSWQARALAAEKRAKELETELAKLDWQLSATPPSDAAKVLVPSDEYEALRQIQFYARQGGSHDNMVMHFLKELDEIEKRNAALDGTGHAPGK